MFIYTIIKNALPKQKEANDKDVKGWSEVAHAWLKDTVADPAEIDEAFEQLIADGTIVVKGIAANNGHATPYGKGDVTE